MAEKSDSVDKALKDAYYDIESSASLGTWQKLRDEVEKTVKNVDKEKVLDFLLRQPSYSIFKRRVEKFPRRLIIRKRPYQTIASDLIDVSSMAVYNKGLKWICLIVDIFSEKIFLKGLKQKSTVEMKECMSDFLKTVPPQFTVELLWTDEGECMCVCVCACVCVCVCVC